MDREPNLAMIEARLRVCRRPTNTMAGRAIIARIGDGARNAADAEKTA